MKNKYDDIILRYFSGLLDEEEAKKLETEMDKNAELKKNFEDFRIKMADINELNPEEYDQGYFTNLIPRVHEKLDKRSGSISVPFQKALGFGLAAALLMFVLLQSGGDNVQYDSGTVLSAIEKTGSEELNEFVELRYGDTQLYDVITEIDLDSYSDAINDQIAENNETLYNYTDYAYYGIEGISGITENEENDIYKSLINKKIL